MRGISHPAHEADLARPGHPSGQRAHQEAALLLAEDHRPHVGQLARCTPGVQQLGVDEHEARVRVARGDRLHGVLQHEAHAHREGDPLIDEELQVGLVVLLRLALQHRRLDGHRLHPRGEALGEGGGALRSGGGTVAATLVHAVRGPELQAPERGVVEGLIPASTDVGHQADARGPPGRLLRRGAGLLALAGGGGEGEDQQGGEGAAGAHGRDGLPESCEGPLTCRSLRP